MLTDKAKLPEQQIMKASKVAEIDDEKIWTSLIEGNELAFDQLYNKYFKVLFVYASQLCTDRELIKDCIQELFVVLWRKRDTLSKVKFVRPYLYKSIRRKILKNRRRQNYLLTNHPIADNLQVVYSRERELIESQTTARNKQLLHKAFESLTDRQKEVVILKYYHGLSYQEISTVMSFQQVKSVRTLLYRALDVLRSNI